MEQINEMMEIENLVSVLEQTISYLRNSALSDPSHISIEEIVRRLEAEVAKAKNLKPIDVNFLDRLFAPNGVIQVISTNNGWGSKFLRISEVVDQFTSGK
jgi:hypothetical protein